MSNDEPEKEEPENDRHDAFMRLLAMALADDVFSYEELEIIERLRPHLGLSLREAKRLFRKLRHRLAKGLTPQAIRALMQGVDSKDFDALKAIAFADGLLNERERELLIAAAVHCGISKAEIGLIETVHQQWIRRIRCATRIGVLGIVMAVVVGVSAGMFFAFSGDEEGPSETEILQRVEAQYLDSVVLLQTTYRVSNGVGPDEEAYTWGTGFFVSDEGHIATNKHVAQPWKFEEEMHRRGYRYVKDSVRWHVWMRGAFLRSSGGDVGTHDSIRGPDVVMSGHPSDVMVRLTPRGGRSFMLHRNDTEVDLAILKATVSGPIRPIPLAPTISHLSNLDALLVMGFPFGPGPIEGPRVFHSSHIGRVNHVERTIGVDMSAAWGLSGGPVLDLDGNVVGITTRMGGTVARAICIASPDILALIRSL